MPPPRSLSMIPCCGPNTSIARVTADAARAYFLASRAQAGLFRQDKAVTLAVRGLAMATGKRDTFDLAILLGDLHQDAGRGTDALEAYRRALQVAEDAADRCRALLGCAASNRLIAKIDDAFVALAEAEPLANALRNDPALAEIYYLRGNLYFARGDLTACRSQHEQALAASRRAIPGMAGARAERSGGRPVHGLSHGYGAAAFRRLRRPVRCAWPDADRRIEPDHDGSLPGSIHATSISGLTTCAGDSK